MATNREKLNKMSNEELSATIMAKVSTMSRFSSISGFTNAGKEIAEWLSQEVEEEKKCGNCKNAGKYVNVDFHIRRLCNKHFSSVLNEDEACDKWEAKENWGIDENYTQVANLPNGAEKKEFTEKAYKDILARLDELEESEYHNAMAIERLENINEYESNIDDVETKTADEMFAELGWNKEIDDEHQIEYLDLYRRVIVILKEDFSYYKSIYGNCVAMSISEAEDKAIHKKIEELKIDTCN